MSATLYKIMGSVYPTGFTPSRHRVGPGQSVDLGDGNRLLIGQPSKSARADMIAVVRRDDGTSAVIPLHNNMLNDLTGFGFFIAPRAVEYTRHGLVRTVWLELYSINQAMNQHTR